MMPKKSFGPEQIIAELRQIEVLVAQGKSVAMACKEAGIREKTCYRWRKQYSDRRLDQARRLKELEKENQRLEKLLGDRSAVTSLIMALS